MKVSVMKDVIAKIPTRKKQALAALCLARFCAANRIEHRAIAELIEHLLSVLVATNLPEWDSKATALELGKSVRESIKQVWPAHVSETLFYDLVNSVVEVGLSNMYTVSSEKPLRELQSCLAILASQGITPPSLGDDFYLHGNEDTHGDGWGDVMGAEGYEKVLDAYHKIRKST